MFTPHHHRGAAFDLREWFPMMNFFRRRQAETETPTGPSEYRLHVELEQEIDGRWIAEIADLPGVLAYGKTKHEAVQKAAALALRVIADRLEHDENALRGDTMKLCLQPA
jgi:predicted RNase H-like HicB family nuclease